MKSRALLVGKANTEKVDFNILNSASSIDNQFEICSSPGKSSHQDRYQGGLMTSAARKRNWKRQQKLNIIDASTPQSGAKRENARAAACQAFSLEDEEEKETEGHRRLITETNNDSSHLEEEEDDLESEYDLRLAQPYHNESSEAYSKVVEEVHQTGGKVHRLYADGRREVVFQNGVRRELWPDGYSVVHFTNGDIKQSFPASHKRQRIVYFYSEARTTQTTYPNGLQVFKFSNNQLEKHFPDGTKEISFPDGTMKCVFPETGEEESIFPDGTIQRVNKLEGVTVIEFPNGSRETIY